MAWFTDITLGALGAGVNQPTFIFLNLVIAGAFGALLLLLVTSLRTRPDLVPHVLVLLALATGLWISINWFIQQIGLVDAKKQQEEIMGKPDDARSDDEAEAAEEEEQDGKQAAAGPGDGQIDGEDAGTKKDR